MLLENQTFPLDVRVLHESRALVDSGYQVSVICQRAPNEPWQEVIENIYVFRYPAPLKGENFFAYLVEYSYSFIAMFLLSFFVWSKRGFDIIHTANPPDTAVFIGMFYRLFGKRFVFDQHDLVPELYLARSGKTTSSVVYKFFLWMEKLSFRFSDLVIATNQSYRKIAMERGKLPGDRVVIVRNGPDMKKLHLVSEDPELRKKAQTIIGYVGMIGSQDGLDYLLRSLNRLRNDLGREDFYCVIIGKGNIISDLKKLKQKLGIQDLVWFTGYISEEDKRRYLSTMDIAVVPDPKNGFNEYCTMIKIMEYMTLGKPIVAFDLQEHRVTAEDAALYAKPNDELDFAKQIAVLMDDPKTRNKMGAFGKDRIENKLAWKFQAENLVKAYENLKTQ